MNVDQALQAIQDLYGYVADAMRRPGVFELGLGSNSYRDIADKFHKTRAEYDKWCDDILDAKRRLYASGFDMPDAWAQAEIVYPVALRRRSPRHHYELVLRHDERDDLEKLKAELRGAARLLQVKQGAKPDAPRADAAPAVTVLPKLPALTTVRFTRSEAAKYVGVDPKTIDRWMNNYKITWTDVGDKHIEFNLAELDAHREVKAAPKRP